MTRLHAVFAISCIGAITAIATSAEASITRDLSRSAFSIKATTDQDPFAAAPQLVLPSLAQEVRAIEERQAAAAECVALCDLAASVEAHPFGVASAEPLNRSEDAWGNYRFTSELAPSHNRFGFTGHYWDKEASLYYAKARYYDPFTARFTQSDAFLGNIDDPPSLHRYQYGHANPTTFTDPDGHQSKDLYNEYKLERDEKLRKEEAAWCAGNADACQAKAERQADIDRRTSGVLEAAGGIGMVVVGGGVLLADPTPATKVPAWIAVMRGVEHVVAGGRQALTGEITETPSGMAVNDALQKKAGLTEKEAAAVQFAYELGIDVVSAGASVRGGAAAKVEAPRNGLRVGKWTGKEVGGRTVYQRHDIFEPTKLSSWQDPVSKQWKRGTNVERMGDGLAPIGRDGKSVNLHHVLQAEPGPLAEVPSLLHKDLPHKLRGPGESFRNDPVLKRQFEDFRSEYWKQRSKDFTSGD